MEFGSTISFLFYFLPLLFFLLSFYFLSFLGFGFFLFCRQGKQWTRTKIGKISTRWTRAMVDLLIQNRLYKEGDRFEGIFSLAAIINRNGTSNENYRSATYFAAFSILSFSSGTLYLSEELWIIKVAYSDNPWKRWRDTSAIPSDRFTPDNFIPPPVSGSSFPVLPDPDQSDGNHAGIIAARECPLPSPSLRHVTPERVRGGEGWQWRPLLGGSKRAPIPAVAGNELANFSLKIENSNYKVGGENGARRGRGGG